MPFGKKTPEDKANTNKMGKGMLEGARKKLTGRAAQLERLEAEAMGTKPKGYAKGGLVKKGKCKKK
jgi:hypothetical protein